MTNNLKTLLLIGLITVSFNGYSQTKEDALNDAKITSKATLNMDFKTVLKYTPPKIVNIMGGEDAALNLMNTTFDNMKTQGFEFEQADVLSVSEILQEQGEYRCYIEGYNQMKMGDQRIKSKSYLFGIYNEKGQHWWFMEAKQLKNKAMLEQLFPGFETELNIPEDEVTTETIND